MKQIDCETNVSFCRSDASGMVGIVGGWVRIRIGGCVVWKVYGWDIALQTCKVVCR